MSRPPILFYAQHLLGLGHAHRAARLARALADAHEAVLFVTGGLPVPGLDLGGAQEVPLPPLTAGDDAAGTLALPDGSAPPEDYLADRRDRLLALLARHDPALVLLELFPFGRHALAFELAPLLLAVAEARKQRGPAAPRLVVSVRDIVVSKRNQAWYELAVLGVLRQWVDRVLVHGSPTVIPISRSFALADRLGQRLVYTGYIGPRPTGCPPPGTPRGEVVVSGGGGRVAGPLLRTALAARSLSRVAATYPWRLLTGPYLPADSRRELETLLAAPSTGAGRPPVALESFRDDFPHLLRGAMLSVSQAGYNTLLDIVASGVRAVVVPYEGSGDEQPLRARLLAERRLVAVVPETELAPPRLAAAMDRALTQPGFPARIPLDLDGASRSVAILGRLVDEVLAARGTRTPGLTRAPGAGRRGSARRAGPPGRSPRARGARRARA